MEFYDVGTSDLRELWESYLSEPCSASEVQVQSWTQVGGAAIENMKTCRPDVASSVHQGLGQDVLMATREEEWGNVLCLRDKSSLEVVLRDRLMTDAALGGPRPIKSEHSYSLLTSSPPPSPATPGANPHTPNSGSSAGMVGASTINDNSGIDPASLDHHKSLDVRGRIDDMEEDCFLAIPMNAAETPRIDPLSSSSLPHASSSPSSSSSSSSSASSTPPSSLPSSSLPSMSPTPTSTSTLRLLSSSNSTSTIFLKRHSSRLVPEDGIECPLIKDEPISAPSSPIASRQSSCETMDDKSAITMISPRSLHFSRSDLPHTSDSEEDDEEYYQGMEIEEYSDVQCASNEPSLHSSRQSSLPPTPPSSASSDSEGTASASCSPERRDSQHSAHVQNLRGLLTPRLYVTNAVHATRQPIHTPLISCQPKGSTGVLTLTEEEKRTLIAEGYPVPTKLPLTKQEEKSLKKVRRKIKNKISAQESRRKKKEYMDGLERRVTMLSNENSSYRNRLNALEDTNRELLKELQRLQTLLQMQSS